VSGYAPGLLKRALSYFYLKETKSSFEIGAHHAELDPDRALRRPAPVGGSRGLLHEDEVGRSAEPGRQPRFRELDYRTNQNYVGEAVAWQHEKVHFVSPKPEDLPELMEGLIAADQLMKKGRCQPSFTRPPLHMDSSSCIP